MHRIDILEKSKVARNLIPSNFGFIGMVDPTYRLGARDESTQIGSPPAPSSCDSVTYIAGLGPAKNIKFLCCVTQVKFLKINQLIAPDTVIGGCGLGHRKVSLEEGKDESGEGNSD